jgi:serine protease Do
VGLIHLILLTHALPPLQVHSFDIHTDVAMLQVETKGIKLPVAYMGKSSTLQHGEQVVAIGSPFGLENTVTQGVVSNLARLRKNNNNAWKPYIQTDARISPGNSGESSIDLFTHSFCLVSIFMYRH